jgi:hypothetical protein
MEGIKTMVITDEIVKIGFLTRLFVRPRCNRCGQRLYKYAIPRAYGEDVDSIWRWLRCPDIKACRERTATKIKEMQANRISAEITERERRKNRNR